MANQIVISRIQNRRGIRENLPQPLLPGEFALTVDTGELWIGTDPNQPPFGVRTYGSGAGDISSAESIADTQVVSAKFDAPFTEADFDNLVAYLINTVTPPSPAVVLTSSDILWDERETVFIAADTGIDVANTILNVYQAVENSGVGTLTTSYADALAGTYYVSLGALNDISTDPSTTNAFDLVDGDFLFGVAGSNAVQGANAATLINQIHGAQLVTTLSNLQVTTTGIGVGSSTFRDWTVYDNEADLPFAATWVDTGTTSADSVTDQMHLVSGEGIRIERNSADPANDALRITNTFTENAVNEFTLTPTGSFANVTGLTFDIDAISDVIFLDYSLNISGATANDANMTGGGQMVVVGNNNVGTGTATLTDTQVDVRDEVGDPEWANVALFADFDGVDAATAFTEESTNAAVATFNGNAALDTAQFNGATSSLLLDGTNSYVTFPDIAAYDLSTNEWTMEGFVRLNTLPPNTGSGGAGYALATLSYDDGGAELLSFVLATDGFGNRVMARYAGTFEQSTTAMAINTWYHWALVKTTANGIRLYFDGNYRTGDFGAISNDMGASTVALQIGARGAAEYTDGWIDDVRFTNGTARYTGNTTYTVPTAPYVGAPIAYAGDVNFQATYVPGSPNLIQIQYTNTFADSATMRVVRKRWMSF